MLKNIPKYNHGPKFVKGIRGKILVGDQGLKEANSG